jgi:hypothetical protein
VIELRELRGACGLGGGLSWRYELVNVIAWNFSVRAGRTRICAMYTATT